MNADSNDSPHLNDDPYRADGPTPSDDDLRQFVEERIGDPTCEVCRASSWVAIQEFAPAFIPVLTSTRVLGLKLPDESGKPVLPGWLLICNNCGNTKLMARRIIDQWKAEREKGSK